MIQTAAKCPHCGADHNPLLHASFLHEPRSRPADELLPPVSQTYTWLCESCGETYWLDVATGND